MRRERGGEGGGGGGGGGNRYLVLLPKAPHGSVIIIIPQWMNDISL